jgi:hypothetical protein
VARNLLSCSLKGGDGIAESYKFCQEYLAMRISMDMRTYITTVLISLPAIALAQSTPWDRNAMYVGQWECKSDISSILIVDSRQNKRIAFELDDPPEHSLTISENKDRELVERYSAQASQYDVKIVTPGLVGGYCLQSNIIGPHAVDTTIIEKKGLLHCSVYSNNNSSYEFSVDLSSGRYARVDTDGFLMGSGSGRDDPALEVGKCEKK